MEKHYRELKDLLDDQIKKIVKKGDISPQELDNLYKASAIVLDIETRNAMHKAEDEMEEGYSNRGSYGSYNTGNSGHYPYHIFYDGTYGRSYDGRRGMDGDGDGRYNEGMSRNSYDDGSYNRNGSYRNYMRRNSRDEVKDHMVEQLEEMMAEAPDEHTKKAIMRCIDKLDD